MQDHYFDAGSLSATPLLPAVLGQVICLEAPGMRQQGISGWRGVRAGSCYAWHLPADPTCAAVARQVLRDAVAELGLGSELLDDCILMASELGANTLHANTLQANTLHANAKTRAGGGGD